MDSNENSDDFDSFFNTKKSSSSTQQKSSKILDPLEDLFGLEQKVDERPSAGKKTFTGAIKPKIVEETEDDDDLGFDPKKPKATKKSQNLLDDLLAPLETKRPHTGSTIGTKAPISRQSTDTTTETANIFQTQTVRPKTSQGRRTSNMSSTQNPDPLGLFTKEKDSSKPPSRLASPKIQKRSTTADWLGLAKESENELPKADPNTEGTPKTASANKSSSRENIEDSKPTDNYHKPGNVVQQVAKEDTKEAIPTNGEASKKDATSQQFMLMNTLNMETQQNISTLKYQEQQLMMAAQMKQQEGVLMDIQRKQDSLLQKQEQQFQQLFQQQVQRHQQLDELIKQQQQRINNHLQLLMTQPPLVQSIYDLNNESALPAKKDSAEGNEETAMPLKDLTRERQITLEVIQYESDNKRLELENMRLEELIANTKSNYEREIELLERSYKKQIEVLEHHLSSMEKRLNAELEELKLHFQNKITTLEQEKSDMRKSHEEELSNLKQDHEDDVRKMRRHQEEDMEILKEEHRRMLDSIRQAKMLEFAAVQENGSYLDCLKVASSNLEDLSGGLKELKENMHNKIETLHLEREKSLEQREKRLEDAERRLNITEESNELEKKRLMDLVSNLELQMSKMSKESAEENWQLRQKLSSLDAEKSAFDKEKEFFREQMLKDEERIKELKEQQLMETQKLRIQLQEERAQLQVERTKFEFEKRLQTNNNDLQKERLEVETAMQVAQDAARQADLERERYYKAQRQLEQQKRDLSEKEHALNVREEELQQKLLSHRRSQRAAQEAQQKAKIAEQFYQNKLQLLQQRSNEIVEKENHLSQERLLLAQDRIAVHALKMKLSQQPKCALCQLAQKNQEITESLNNLPVNNTTANPKGFVSSPGHSHYFEQTDLVERLLDANIADSLKKMHSSTNPVFDWENLLDDDHKKMIQNDEYEMTKEGSCVPKTDL